MRGVVVLLMLVGVAQAQPRAVAVEATRDPGTDHRHPPAGLGADLVVGWAGQRGGPSGWSARLDYEVLPVFAPRGLFGFQPGFEVWRSGEDNWGFSMPVAFVAGVRGPGVRAIIGGGVDAILIDQVDDDTGVGFYAPFALAKLGADVLGVQVGVDARIGYRWQIGADDHARWQLGVYAGYTASPQPRRRARAVAVRATP